MMGGPRRRGAPMPRMSIKGQGHILKRLMKIVFENYLWQFIAVIVCIVVTAYATIQSSTFTRDLVDVYIAGIQKGTKTMGDLANAMIPLGCVLALGVAASYIRQRLMVSVGQGTMLKIRTDLFTHMESLPFFAEDTMCGFYWRGFYLIQTHDGLYLCHTGDETARAYLYGGVE